MTTTKPGRVAITGASGFVGSKAADWLEARGWEVLRFGRRAVERIPEPARASYRSWDIERGPLIDPPAVDAVVHCAGAVDDWGTFEPFRRANVYGTQAVLATWPEARFVHVSSASVYDPNTDHSLVVETDADPGDAEDTERVAWMNPYGRTKRMAENVVTAQAAERAIILRPHAVYGPGDTQLLPRLTSRIRLGRLVVAGDRSVRVSLTHVDNFSYAIGLALGSEATGAFNISDPTAPTLDECLKVVLRRLGKPERIAWLPAGPVGAAAWAMEAACGFGRGPKPPITRFQLSHLTRDFVYDLTKAQRELAYAPAIDLPAGLETIDVPGRS
jgi:nucleoside-diphosphate-sugar epimerase